MLGDMVEVLELEPLPFEIVSGLIAAKTGPVAEMDQE